MGEHGTQFVEDLYAGLRCKNWQETVAHQEESLFAAKLARRRVSRVSRKSSETRGSTRGRIRARR
jgi:hypothetical protein